MTEEEINVGNKMIALFMGYTEEQIQCENWCGCNVLFECPVTGSKEMIGANYHSSWDWLMAACAKWDKIELDESTDYKIQVQYVELCDKLDLAVSFYEIEPIFKQLVENIKWHNSNSPT